MELNNTFFSRIPKEIAEKIAEYYTDLNLKIGPSGKCLDVCLITLNTNVCEIGLEISLPKTKQCTKFLLENIQDFFDNKIDYIKFNEYSAIKDIFYDKQCGWIVKTGDAISNATFSFKDKKIIVQVLEYIQKILTEKLNALVTNEKSLNDIFNGMDFTKLLNVGTGVAPTQDNLFNMIFQIGQTLGTNSQFKTLVSPLVNQIMGENQTIGSNNLDTDNPVSLDSLDTNESINNTNNIDSDNSKQSLKMNENTKTAFKNIFNGFFKTANTHPLDNIKYTDIKIEKYTDDYIDEEIEDENLTDEIKKELESSHKPE